MTSNDPIYFSCSLMGLNMLKLLNFLAYWASGVTILSQSCTVHHQRKKSQRCENGAKERQETWIETNMQREGIELDEKSEFKVSQEYKNDTCFKSHHSKLFYMFYTYGSMCFW